RPPRPPLFPYTTLFRSPAGQAQLLQHCLTDERVGERVAALVAQHAGAQRFLDRIQQRLLREVTRRLQDLKGAAIAEHGSDLEHPDRKSTRLNSSHVAIS